MTKAAIATPVIAYDTAANLVRAAMAHASENGWTVAVVVLDPGGAVVAAGRIGCGTRDLRIFPLIKECRHAKLQRAIHGRCFGKDFMLFHFFGAKRHG